MKIAEYKEFEIDVPTSGGKAGKGRNTTTTVRVFHKDGSLLLYQTRCKVGDELSRRRALHRARVFCDRYRVEHLGKDPAK